MPYEWSQTEETLQIVLSLDKMCAEELKEADVVVTDVNVHVKLPGNLATKFLLHVL